MNTKHNKIRKSKRLTKEAAKDARAAGVRSNQKHQNAMPQHQKTENPEQLKSKLWKMKLPREVCKTLVLLYYI
jgi:hypothetical protein